MNDAVVLLSADGEPVRKSMQSKNCLWRSLRSILIALIMTGAFALLLLWYFCGHDTSYCNPSTAFRNWPNASTFASTHGTFKRPKILPVSNLTTHIDFDIRKPDVLVLLQVQNTGSSVFAHHLVNDLDLEQPCLCHHKRRRLCRCYRPRHYGSSWLFSRETMGWKCGVHPDWTQLTSCVDKALDEDEGRPVKRRYFFMTVLRDPIKRFLSEFRSAERAGVNWKSARLQCGGREVTSQELPPCFTDLDMTDELTLETFLSCPFNLALNRQTRMLADLTMVGCYNHSAMPQEERRLILLKSAENNLRQMAFFGLADYPKISAYMFQATFGLRFKRDRILSKTHSRGGRQTADDFSLASIAQVKEANHLDIELYQYAKQLLFYRFEKLKNSDPAFEDNFKFVEKDRLSSFDWAEREEDDAEGVR